MKYHVFGSLTFQVIDSGISQSKSLTGGTGSSGHDIVPRRICILPLEDGTSASNSSADGHDHAPTLQMLLSGIRLQRIEPEQNGIKPNVLEAVSPNRILM